MVSQNATRVARLPLPVMTYTTIKEVRVPKTLYVQDLTNDRDFVTFKGPSPYAFG
jgi:hypothetical protein